MASYAITGIEAVQAVQTADNRVPMIGGKTTFLRVYVKADVPLELTGRLAVQVGGSGTASLDPLSSAPVVATAGGSQREVWKDSLNFRLDDPLVAPGVRKITATIQRADGGSEPAPAPSDHTKTITLWFSPRIDLKVYGVVWAATDGSDFPGTGYEGGGPAPWADFEAHRRFVQNVHPVSSCSVLPLAGVGTEPPKPQPFQNLTGARKWAQKQLATLPEEAIINLMCNWDLGGLQGLADGRVTEEQNARDARRVGVVMAQELAHALGIPWHTFLEKGRVTPYPREDGTLGAGDLGIRLTNGGPELVGGVFYPDVMSYSMGNDGSWISSFTYTELLSAITARLPWQPVGGAIDGPVVTTSWGPGRLDVFARFADGSVRHRFWDHGVWAPKVGWENLGGNISGRLAAVSWGPNRIDVFGRGLDGALYHKYWNGAHWGPDPAHIDDWGFLGGEIDGPIAATSWGKDRLDVFARFSDGRLGHAYWAGSGWATPGVPASIWESLGGRIEGHMAAVSPAFNRLDVVARGTDGGLHHKYWDGKVWGPDPENLDRWERLGGEIDGPVAMTSWAEGRLDVFARFKDSTLRHTWSQGNGWGGWESLGGRVADGAWNDLHAQVPETLVAVAPSVNRLDVFIQGTDRAVWRKSWNGTHWTPTDVDWQELKGKVDGAMAAVSWGPERADVFVRGTDGGLWHKSRSGPIWAGAS